jgi:hypothetical protein
MEQVLDPRRTVDPVSVEIIRYVAPLLDECEDFAGSRRVTGSFADEIVEGFSALTRHRRPDGAERRRCHNSVF